MDPRHITSDAQIGASGLYIRERRAPATVQGVTRQDVAIVGECVRGPVDQAIEVTSEARFLEVFGGRDGGVGGEIEGQVWKAMLNKPFGRSWIVRAAAADAEVATRDFDDGATGVLQVDASSPGDWGNDVRVTIEAATNGDEEYFDLRASWNGIAQRWRNLTIAEGQNNIAAVMGDDPANLVKLTKLASGRPDDVSDEALAAGDDGTVADTDFIASGRALDVAGNKQGPSAVLVAGRSNEMIKASINTRAANSHDRQWLICADSETVAPAAARAEVGDLTRHDRLVYCFNHAYTLDPETGEEILTEPHAWMATILSQTDADVHPGDADNAPFLAGIIRLHREDLAPGEYDSFREAGVSALIRDDVGFVWADAVTTSLEDGKTEVAFRRMKDFIIAGLAARARRDVKKSNSQDRRNARADSIGTFLEGLAKSGRYVDMDEQRNPLYVYDTETLNTEQSRATGLQRDLARIKLIPFANFLVLETQVSPTVRVTEV